jgi:uncharacterized protein
MVVGNVPTLAAHLVGADHYPGPARLGAPGVGGGHAGARIVRVSARAVDGKATEAALAAAFGVRRGAVTLVAGASGRTKIVDVADGDPGILADPLARPEGG